LKSATEFTATRTTAKKILQIVKPTAQKTPMIRLEFVSTHAKRQQISSATVQIKPSFQNSELEVKPGADTFIVVLRSEGAPTGRSAKHPLVNFGRRMIGGGGERFFFSD
jgi:hypothetical protein